MTRKLQRALEQQKHQTEPYNQEITGLLGIPLSGQKRVEVPNRNGYVFVRLRDNQSEVIQAYNNKVSTSYGLPVILQREGSKYVVVGFDSRKYENNLASQSAFVPRHGNQHSFDIESGGGGDIVWVYPRQFMPSLVIPSGSVGAGDVIVNSYILRKNDGTWKYTGNTGTASLLPYKPTSTGAIMALVYLDALTGNPNFLINSGTVFSSSITGSSQIAPFIPQATGSSVIPLAAIRLVSGTSKISWENIYDVRQFLHVTPTGSAGGGGGITDAPSDSKNYGRRNAAWVDLDSYYLKLDASNDPLTGQLSINPGNAGGGVYVTLGAAGSFSNYNGFNLHRINADSFAKYPIEIYDEGFSYQFNYNAGAFLHYNDNRTLIDINPYVDPDGTFISFNSENNISPTGTIFLLRNQDVEKFRVYGNGTVNIPSGTTYNIGGVPHTHAGGGGDGWTAYSAVVPTLTVSDDPTYTLQFAGVNLTGTVCEAMPIKWTQNSITRYGWFSSAPIYSGSNTYITVLTRTDEASADYNVLNTSTYPISNFNYAPPRQPGFGFPLLRTNWRVETTSTSSLSQLTPTANTWYNILTISAPIGYWNFGYELLQAAVHNSATAVEMRTTLSTGNNTGSNPEYTVRNEMSGSSGNWSFVLHASVENALAVAAKITWYLNILTYLSGEAGIYVRGDIKTTTIYLNCKYLEG